VACGSDDPSKSAPADGEGGAGGEVPSSAGSSNAAGSQTSAGKGNSVGGQAGEAATGNQAGAPMFSGGAAGAAGAAGATGDGGQAGEAPLDTGLPPGCPGVIDDYTLLLGSAADDLFTNPELNGKVLVHGLQGNDTFPQSGDGSDCLVGGPGDDDFTNSNEQASYFVGGPGDDWYHINTHANYVNLVDMEPGDVIALSLTTFPFLGLLGDSPDPSHLKAVPGYSTGTSSGVVEGSCIVYDPNTGELWEDPDGGDKGTTALQIGTILNHDTQAPGGYVFDINDFLIEE
jgi:hypothetical protein